MNLLKLSDIYKNDSANRTNIGGLFFCAACFLIFPLIIHNYSDTTIWKIQTFTAILSVSAVLCIASALIDKSFARKDILKSPTLWFILAYAAVCVISVLLSPYSSSVNSSGQTIGIFGSGRTDGLLYILMYLLALLIPALFCGFRKSFAYLLAVAGGINAVMTVLQLFGLNIFGLIPGAPLQYVFIQFAGTFGNVDFLSAFLCFCACFIGGYYIISDDGKQRYILPIAFALIIYTELSIGVSSGLIGLIAAAGATLPLFLSHCDKLPRIANLLIALLAGILPSTVISHTYASNRTTNSFTFGTGFFIVLALLIFAVAARILLVSIKPKYKRKTAIIVLYSVEAVLLVAAILIIKFAFSGKSGLLGEISALLNGNISPMAGSHRIAIWQYTLKMFEDKPWLCVGTGSFSRAFSNSVLAEYQQVIGKNTLPDAAHNEYLQQLATVGIIGFAAYMGWFLSIFIRGFKYALKNPKLTVCLCAAAGFAAQMSFNINIIIIAPYFYIILGITEYEILSTKRAAANPPVSDKPQVSEKIPKNDITV